MISCVRRTSIVVEDMELSKKFYMEGVGLKVFYDSIIEAEASKKLMYLPDVPKVHLVSLQSGDDESGMVGLMKFMRPDWNTRSSMAKEKKTDIVLVFRTDECKEKHAKFIELGFSPSELVEYEIPQRGMARAFSCFDPSGVLCEFTQYLF